MSNGSTARIVQELQQWIASAAPGAKLPSTRTLVEEYRASPVTVQKAVQSLVALGVVETRPGIGTFALEQRSAAPVDYSWQTGALGPRSRASAALSPSLRTVGPGVIEFHSGYPEEELLPVNLVRAGFKRMMRQEVATRPPAAGLPELRSWFASALRTYTPSDLQPPTRDDVVVVPGSQSGLSAVFRALVGPNEPLLVESPTYWGALIAARQARVRLVPIPSGPQGPDPEELERAFRRYGARAFYAQPNFANPTGATWSAEIRHRTLELAEQARAFVIEDDWAHDFGIDTAAVPLAAMDRGGNVVYVRSLTKSVSPSVRVAAVVARGPAFDRILAESQSQSMYVSGVLQAVAYDVVTQPGWKTHLRSLTTELGRRRDVLLDALQRHAPDFTVATIPSGGLNLWVRLPREINSHLLVRRCEEAGVGIGPGDECFPTEAPATYTRLNFSGPNPELFPEGIVRLASVVESLAA